MLGRITVISVRALCPVFVASTVSRILFLDFGTVLICQFVFVLRVLFNASIIIVGTTYPSKAPIYVLGTEAKGMFLSKHVNISEKSIDKQSLPRPKSAIELLRCLNFIGKFDCIRHMIHLIQTHTSGMQGV